MGPSSRAHHVKNEPRTVIGRNQWRKKGVCGLGEPHDHELDGDITFISGTHHYLLYVFIFILLSLLFIIAQQSNI